MFSHPPTTIYFSPSSPPAQPSTTAQNHCRIVPVKACLSLPGSPGRGSWTCPPSSSSSALSISGKFAMKLQVRAALSRIHFALLGLAFLSSGWVHLGSSMEVTVQPYVVKLNGTSAKLTCTFNSCYEVNEKRFFLNWTYSECEECPHDLFVQFRHKVVIHKNEHFSGRVEWSGNLVKNDVSLTIHDIQLSDEGFYNCSVLNPPDRHNGWGLIYLRVVTEVAPERDSTVAVIIGASVGGFLAVVILILVIVKCVRRKKKQDHQSEDQKTEEEGKTDGEGNQEEDGR
ncbi:sodium channel subunit beta-2 isoform X2 [Scyliorhinus canicula]|nr:sodium channel subunit beta-2 isoform X2 [Scyliorhinus canicula]